MVEILDEVKYLKDRGCESSNLILDMGLFKSEDVLDLLFENGKFCTCSIVGRSTFIGIFHVIYNML